MSDMIRKSDALAVVRDFKRDFDMPWRDQMTDAIAALPAVAVTDPDDPTLEEIVVVLSGWIDRLIRERVDLRQKLAALEPVATTLAEEEQK